MRRDGSVPRKDAQEERRRPTGTGGPPDQMPAAGVKVVCRLRPMNEREKKAGTVPAATASTERREVAVVRMLGGTRKVSTTFHFDDVLTSFSSQAEVFQSTLEPLIAEVLAGYEATAFAYGQTGTGKTYTMEGDVESDDGRGLVPRAAASVIDALSGGRYTDYTVTVSYLEIYNEDLSDLLAPSHMQQQKLDLKDTGGGRGVCCQGLSEVPVSSVNDILELVHRAQERRRVAETRVNARSSRSHSIFTMKVRCRKVVATGELENVGKLHLVDLAGSECAKKASPAPEANQSGAVRPCPQPGADEERERKNINQSLLTLGRVITALRDGSGRVPYRDSKLTRLLQDSLGGRCKTVIIATISPALGAVEETISTLTYAEQASGIQNRPVASSLLRTLRYAASGEVKGEGTTNLQGTSDFAELELKVAYLSQEVEEAQAALARKYREAQEQADRAQSAEERLVEAEDQLESARQSIKEGKFVRVRLMSYADHQTEAAAELTKALKASSQHGDTLASLLADSNDKVLASRTQAKRLLETWREMGEEIASSAGQKQAETIQVFGEVHAAHASACTAACDAIEEQGRLLASLSSKVQEGGAKLMEQLGSASAELRKVVDDEQRSSADSLATIEAAASQVAAAAAKAKADSAASIARDGEALRSQAEALRQDLGTGQESLQAGASQLVEDLNAARKTNQTGHEQACRRLQSTIQEPLDAHEASLQEGASLASAHSSALAALAESGAEDSHQSAEQRQSIREALTSALTGHARVEEERPRALGKAQEAIGQTAEVQGKALEAVLDALGERLSNTKSGLAAATHHGQTALTAVMEATNAKLAAAWEEEGHGLAKLQATITEACDQQRAGHAAKALQAAAKEAAEALSAALASALAELDVARENVAGQVAELQQQRAKEQEIVDMLTQQRETLRADVDNHQNLLAGLRTELESAKADALALQEEQRQRRSQALEAIQAVVAAELSSLGDALSTGTEALTARLAVADGQAQAVAEAATEAEERCDKKGTEVGNASGEWSQAIDRSCGAISAAQARALAAAEAAGHAGQTAEGALDALGAQGAAWGEACDHVSELLGGASQQRGALLAAAEALRPQWEASREQALQVASSWSQGCQRSEDGLAMAATDTASARRDLQALREGVATRCGEAVGEAELWRRDTATHNSALRDLSTLAEAAASQASLAEERRRADVEQRHREAQDLSLRAGQSLATATSLVTSATAHAQALPVDFASTDAAMASAAAGMEALCGQAATALTAGSEGVTALADAQGAAAQAVCDLVATQTDKAASAAKMGGTVAAHYQKAIEASLAAIKKHALRADEAREEAVGSLAVAAEASGSCAQQKAEEASARQKSGLEAGGSAKDRSLASLASLTADTSAGLQRLQTSLKEGLSAKPLSAFSEELAPLPERPEAAAWPAIELLPRPKEEELVAEFKGKEAEFNDAENLGSKKIMAKEALRALAWGPQQGPVDTAGPLPRRALAEIN